MKASVEWDVGAFLGIEEPDRVEERRVDSRRAGMSGTGSIDTTDRVELWTFLGADPIPTSIEPPFTSALIRLFAC